MPNTSLADRIRANAKSRAPVQETVDAQFDEIENALANGGSFRTIHAQLTREGHNVGRGHGSLYAAYKAVKQRRAVASNVRTIVQPTNRAGADADTKVAESSSITTARISTPIVDTRRNLDNW